MINSILLIYGNSSIVVSNNGISSTDSNTNDNDNITNTGIINTIHHY